MKNLQEADSEDFRLSLLHRLASRFKAQLQHQLYSLGMLHSMAAQSLLCIRFQSAIIGWERIVIRDGTQWETVQAQLSLLQD